MSINVAASIMLTPSATSDVFSRRETGVAMSLQVTVDARKCIATKACINAAGDVFAIVGGVSQIVPGASASDEDLLLAVEACPVGAISVVTTPDS